MILVPTRRPFSIHRAIRMNHSRVQSRPRRHRPTRHAMIIRAHHNLTATILASVQLTTKLFTAAVFIYCGLNFLMYRRIRKLSENKEEKHSDDNE